MRALLRVDATPEVGLGHLQRCLSLAAALAHSGCTSVFLTASDTAALSWISKHDFAVMAAPAALGTVEDAAATLAAAASADSDLVVVDSYQAGEEYLAQLAAEKLVAAVDDLFAHPFPCHLVVNAAANPAAHPYEPVRSSTRLLLGPRYALLRPEFWSLPALDPGPVVEHVVVLAGGSDPWNLAPRLLRALDRLPHRFNLTAVVGPLAGNRGDVANEAKRCERDVQLVDAPTSVLELMLDADLAITAAGQTLYELAAAGTPAIAVAVAANQTGNLETFAAAGAVVLAGEAASPDIEFRVADLVADLAGDLEARERMSKAGRELVDGRGALRVAAEIVALASRSQAAAA